MSPTQLATVSDAAKHGTLSVDGLNPIQAQGVLVAFKDAFMQGFHPALVFAGCILLVAAVIANRFIPGRETVAAANAAAAGQPQPQGQVAVEM